MPRQKSFQKKIAEGRCKGIGPTYMPFYLVEESKSLGTACRIPDPIEGRDIHCLSTVETGLYYHLRWDTNVKWIREQWLLDSERVKPIAKELGINTSGKYYTTDFLVDYFDGSKKAFSAKWKRSLFDPLTYKGERGLNDYERLIKRCELEKRYWESLGIPFHIVTEESLNPTLTANVKYVMGFWYHDSVTTKEHKVLYLIAHRYIDYPMWTEQINPLKLIEECTFDIDWLYDQTVVIEQEYRNKEK